VFLVANTSQYFESSRRQQDFQLEFPLSLGHECVLQECLLET
jgi:hypothetical protein